MAKGLGNNYFVWVESAVAGTYNLIKGQQSGKVTRNAGNVDLSTKDNAGYGSTAPGLKDWSIDLSVIPDLPDATGYTRLETLCAATPQVPFNVQIRKGGTAGVTGDAVFAGSVYGNIDGTDFAQNGAVGVTVKLLGNGAPTADTLAI
jgi:predicted secreted protein